jgi:hypothetical protein
VRPRDHRYKPHESKRGETQEIKEKRKVMFFTEEQNLALKRFAELEAKLGSQSKACQQIGISAAIISQLRKGTYKAMLRRSLPS